jgi:hypothetical protein
MSDWCEMLDELNKRARAHELEAIEHAKRTRAMLLAERSKFLEEFDANQRRIFGVEDIP